MTYEQMPASVVQRLEALERRISRLRMTLVALASLAIVCIGGAMARLPQAGQDPQELTVSRLVVVDDKGTPRILIGTDKPGVQRISRSTGITIDDENGAERFGVGVMENGQVSLGLDAPPGVGNAMRDRLGLAVGSDGSSSVMLLNNKTEVPVRLVSSDDGGGVEFLAYDKPNSKVIVKRLTFKGEETKEFHHDFPKD
jgi:hypothetical protein